MLKLKCLGVNAAFCLRSDVSGNPPRDPVLRQCVPQFAIDAMTPTVPRECPSAPHCALKARYSFAFA